MTPCSVAEVRTTAIFSVDIFETSVRFYRILRPHIPQDSIYTVRSLYLTSSFVSCMTRTGWYSCTLLSFIREVLSSNLGDGTQFIVVFLSLFREIPRY